MDGKNTMRVRVLTGIACSLLLCGVAQADYISDWKDQNGGKPATFEVVNGCTELTIQRKIMPTGANTRDSVVVRINKNGSLVKRFETKPYTGTGDPDLKYVDPDCTSGDVYTAPILMTRTHEHYSLSSRESRRGHSHRSSSQYGKQPRRHVHKDTFAFVESTGTTPPVDPPVDPPIDPPVVVADLLKRIDSAGNEDTRDVSTKLYAFAGATGSPQYSEGGRGAPVYCVNSLADNVTSGDGLITYREAIESAGDVPSGARNITFCVSGIIDTGNVSVKLRDNNVSILGQTAPYPGVVIKGNRPLDIAFTDDLIARFVGIKVHDSLDAGLNSVARAVTIASSTNTTAEDLMFDHMSLLGSTDDNFTSFTAAGDNTRVPPKRVGLTNSIAGEGDTTCLRPDFECGSGSGFSSQQNYAIPSHAMGPYFGSANTQKVEQISFVGNVLPNSYQRTPWLRNAVATEVHNNIISNGFGNGIQFTGTTTGWVDGNIIKHGPSTSAPQNQLNIAVSTSQVVIKNNVQIEVDGTITTDYETNGNDATTLSGFERTTLTGNNQLNLSCVGASVPTRDAWDTRIINEINGTGPDPILSTAVAGIGSASPWNETFCGVDPGDGSRQCFYEDGNTDEYGYVSSAGEIGFGQGKRDWSTFQGAGSGNVHPASYDTDSDGIPDSYEQQWLDLYNDDAYSTLAHIDHTTTQADIDQAWTSSLSYTVFEKWTHHLAASCSRGET